MDLCRSHYHLLFSLLLLASLAALLASFGAEILCGLIPCAMCTLQRIPYFFIGVFSFLGIATPHKKKMMRTIQAILFLGFSLGLAHVGIQAGKVKNVCRCDLFSPSAPSCSESSWEIFGLPAPLYSSALSFVLLLGSEWFIRKKALLKES